VSLKRNLIATYANHLYCTAIGIVAMPLYLGWMGPEAFGLIGVFVTLQVCLNLLDVGLTPTASREAARFRSGATDPLEYRRRLRALQLAFLGLAAMATGALLLAAGAVARDWLDAKALAPDEVRRSLELMALAAGARWFSGLVRGTVWGFDRLVWLAGFTMTIATLRAVGVFPLFIVIGPTPTVFFAFQLAVSLIELVGLAAMSYRLLPAPPCGLRIGWSLAPLKPVLHLSLSLAATTGLWVLVSQADRVLLSRLLPLADFGYFTLAALVGGAVMLIATPIGTAIQGRMAGCDARGDTAGLIGLYRDATQLVAVITLPVGFTLAAFAEPVLWAWTGDRAAAAAAGPILAPYALGNAVLAVAALPFSLQYARGDLRLHIVGGVLFALVLLPALVMAATTWGGVGAGWAWLGANLAYLLAWVPWVHRRMMPGQHTRWITHDLLPPLATATVCALLSSRIDLSGQDRLSSIAVPMLLGITTLVATALSSSLGRLHGRSLFHRVFS
jgi:O-antigen/teichoic acid export membrane protein